jgi:hypothetical protein
MGGRLRRRWRRETKLGAGARRVRTTIAMRGPIHTKHTKYRKNAIETSSSIALVYTMSDHLKNT